MTPLGMYVKRCREQRGWTVAELSRKSGVPYGTIRNIEQNEQPVKPREDTLRALSSAFGPETLDLLFALAGYGVPMSQTVEARNRTIDMLFAAHPEWEKVLRKVERRSPADRDRALHVLKVFLELQDERS